MCDWRAKFQPTVALLVSIAGFKHPIKKPLCRYQGLLFCILTNRSNCLPLKSVSISV